MKKMFTRRLFLYMLAGLVITISVIFALQTVINQKENTASSGDKLAMVKERMRINEENIENLTVNLGENNLAKTRAFADMLVMDDTIAGDMAKLNEIKDRLMVNELHIIDENGIITSSTIEAYIGFDMKSGEQSNAFMVIVDDPSIEIVQEPQKGCKRACTGGCTTGSSGKYAGWYGNIQSPAGYRFWEKRICVCD